MANDKALQMLKENLSYPKDNIHPIAKSDIEFRNQYLNALAVLLKIDGEIHDSEKKYILRLIKLFGLPDNKLDEMIEFGENPDPDILSEYINFFKNKNEKYHLIIDCLIISKIDNDFSVLEIDLIDTLSNIFNIEENEKKLLENFALIVQNSDVEKAFNLLIDNKELFEKFKPLLLPYGIDISKYHEELKKILDFDTEEWEFYINSKKFPLEFFPAKSPVTNKQFVYFLNYVNDTHLLEIVEVKREKEAHNLNPSSVSSFFSVLATEYNLNVTPSEPVTFSFIIDEEKEVYLCLSTSKIISENGEFLCKKEDLSIPVTGIDGKVANIYSRYVANVFDKEVKVISFDLDADSSSYIAFIAPGYHDNPNNSNSYNNLKYQKINKQNFDEIVFVFGEYYCLNRATKDNYCSFGQCGENHKGFVWRYLSNSSTYGDKNVLRPIEFSDNLTFRLMKKVLPKMPENKI